MTFKPRSFLLSGLFLALISTLFVTSCGYPPTGYYKRETATRLAMPSFMHDRVIVSDPFRLTVYERVRNKGGIANVYIEGNGHDTGISLETIKPTGFYIGGDDTPYNPVGLHLASFDHAKNLIYMARPCQYTEDDPACTAKEKKYLRYGEEELNAMNKALSHIKNRYDFTGFNLIGYGGGGAIATILAAKRDDVLTLRTVSGHLDTSVAAANNDGEKAVDLGGRINPLDYAEAVSGVPQHHFMGEHDKIITPDTYMRFYRETAPRRCLRFSLIENADSDKGLVNAWPELRKLPVSCVRTEPPGTIIINKIKKQE